MIIMILEPNCYEGGESPCYFAYSKIKKTRRIGTTQYALGFWSANHRPPSSYLASYTSNNTDHVSLYYKFQIDCKFFIATSSFKTQAKIGEVAKIFSDFYYKRSEICTNQKILTGHHYFKCLC